MIDHFTDPTAPEPSDDAIDAYIVGMDPVSDTPPAVSVSDSITFSALQITALPPEAQQIVRDKLVNVTPGNRDLFERQYVEEEAKKIARVYRVKTGLGDGATEYHREMFSIENERRL